MATRERSNKEITYAYIICYLSEGPGRMSIFVTFPVCENQPSA